LTIQAGKTALFTITFAPQASGAAAANVSFTTSASNTPVTEALSGTGAAAPQHSVDLSWNPSASSVTGYNVYRGGTTGGPYAKLNSTVDAGTNFTDSSVQAGQNYFYVTTAVGSDGTESSFSNEVHAAIPTP
jgi:fibronectin type 3 domain-containing protein